MTEPGYLNRVCAHPVAVCWFAGAATLDAIVVITVLGRSAITVVGNWQVALLLLVALVAASGLGLFLGMFTLWPLVRMLASKYNGAPLEVGDEVIVLSGPDRGCKSTVYETPTGQGGWKLARLDFGEDRAQRFRDIFEQYSVYKLSSAG